MTEYKATILAVDDDERNLRLLRLDLEDDGYEVLTAKDGVEAIASLKQNNHIQLILLDRMMPNMNGMEVMKIIKADPILSKIPVIMQTAAAEKQQVIEGIKAGVYYYLTKPFSEELLLAVVKTAIENYSYRLKLREEVMRFKLVLGLFVSTVIHIKTLAESQAAAAFIANMFPNPDEVVSGISEFMLNAIEHGNLGIGYHKKRELVIAGKWQDEIEARLLLPEYRDKYATIQYVKKPDCWDLTISDQGNGFDYKQYLSFAVERVTDPNGRGIAISIPAFSKVEYVGTGNKVICTVMA